MILQALQAYYDRLADDPDSGIARPGFSEQKISFVVVLNPDGTLHEIKDGRREEVITLKTGKEKTDLRPTMMIVPGGEKPSGKVTTASVRKKAGYLWNDASYVLGIENNEGRPPTNILKFEAFRDNHLAVSDTIDDEHFSILCSFLRTWEPEAGLQRLQGTQEVKLLPGFGVFQVRAYQGYLHQQPAIISWWQDYYSKRPSAESIHCLVSGTQGPLARKHEPKIKGVAASSPPPGGGHLLVSFNEPAFCSYGKEQGANAPVSEAAAFAYCNALNLLLGRDRQRLQIGDATTVFWTGQSKVSPDEVPADEFVSFLLDSAQLQPQNPILKEGIRRALEKAANGKLAKDDLGDPTTPFYILGLSPNASRLSVRFWLHSTLGEITERLQRHIHDLAIVRQWDETAKHPDPAIPSIWQLLRQTARESKDIPPLLSGALMQAILGGGAYPDALATAILRRIKADRDINYLRASALKAWLVRNHHQPIQTMLDETNHTPGYLLGRLFSALERTQQDALGQVNASIRDRYYSSASSTPRAVFPRLLKTYGHHIAKLDGGRKVNREKLLQDVLGPIQTFPAHLTLKQQGLFALGYYHQQKAFYTRKAAEETDD